jgi:hypothetical protein
LHTSLAPLASPLSILFHMHMLVRLFGTYPNICRTPPTVYFNMPVAGKNQRQIEAAKKKLGMPAVLCSLLSALCFVLSAICSLSLALCSLLSALCTLLCEPPIALIRAYNDDILRHNYETTTYPNAITTIFTTHSLPKTTTTQPRHNHDTTTTQPRHNHDKTTTQQFITNPHPHHSSRSKEDWQGWVC